MNAPPSNLAFSGCVDLASSRLGGRALAASDEFFAAKENLLRPEPATFDPDRYTELGKWMDGWESRRRRTPGHDWCIVRLGVAGRIRGVDVDTSNFLGNNPPYASIDAATLADEREASLDQGPWRELLPRSPLAPGSHNLFAVADDAACTHVRLNIYPDGGVARLRVYGDPQPDWSRLPADQAVDVASILAGGIVVAASDMFFGSKESLIMPGVAASMRDGWETRRRRGPGYDWAIVRLGRPVRIERVEVDTRWFKGNAPDQCSIDVCRAPEEAIDALSWTQVAWKGLLPKTKLEPDRNHAFKRELADAGPVSHVMLNIYPDGGVSRLRVFGRPE